MRIAINGCGIAGPTLAWWLRKYGYEPVIFEEAPALRSGGYIIDFWGSGYDIAEKMGLFPRLLDDAYIMERLRSVTGGGHTTSLLNVHAFQKLTNNRYLSIARADLSRQIFRACDGIEVRFGMSVVDIDDNGKTVEAKLSDGGREVFDLVIGADGLHSQIRALTFGPQSRFEHHSGFYVAAFTIDNYTPREDLTYVSHTIPGRQIARVSLRDNRTLILFVFSNRFVEKQPVTEASEKALLRTVYSDMQWEAPAILQRMEEAENVYFDRVSQIRMANWTKGRTALVGDAAACASLLAGEGTGLAMTEAYTLAGELRRACGNHSMAFSAYQQRLHPYLVKKQDLALKFAGFFAPKNWLSLAVKEVLTNIASIPFLTKPLLGGSFQTDLDLPSYEEQA